MLLAKAPGVRRMLTKVASYTNAIEAHLARLRLEAEEVPAFIFNEHQIWLQWDMSQALGGVWVYVNAHDLERARNILAAHDSGVFALADEDAPVCPRCGSNAVVPQRSSWKAAMLTTHLAALPLYFRLSGRTCGDCAYTWDLPQNPAYSLLVILLAMALLAIPIGALVVAALCQDAASGCF